MIENRAIEQRITEAPATARKGHIKSLVDSDGALGPRALSSTLPGGKEELIIALDGMTQAHVHTPLGEVTLAKTDGDATRRNGGVLIDLSKTTVHGKPERNGGQRQIDVGDDGIGAMQVNKRVILWVHP